MDAAVDTLTSPSTTHTAAFDCLQNVLRLLRDIDPSRALAAFKPGHEWRVTARLLSFLALCTCRLEIPDNNAASSSVKQLLIDNISATLIIIQGHLLLHPPSSDLFSRSCYFEMLTRLLSLSPKSIPDTVANSTLDTILCAIVDSPRNFRTFENCAGLANIAGILRCKAYSRTLHNKCLELLFLYLSPEQSPIQQISTELRDNVTKHYYSSSVDSSPLSSPTKMSASRRKEHRASAPNIEFSNIQDIDFDRGPIGKLGNMLDSWTPSTPSRNSAYKSNSQSPITPLKQFKDRRPKSEMSPPVCRTDPRRRSLNASLQEQARNRLLVDEVFGGGSPKSTPVSTRNRPDETKNIRRRSTLVSQIKADDVDIHNDHNVNDELGRTGNRNDEVFATPRHPRKKGIESTSTKDMETPTQPNNITNTSLSRKDSADKRSNSKLLSSKQSVRTVEQKKKILSKYLGNVDGLVSRFQELGIMNGH